MNAETLARALGGRRIGSHWMAPCPVHDDRNPSFSIKDAEDGKVLVYCHAGCGQSAVINELRSRGLWDDASGRWRPSPVKNPQPLSHAPNYQSDSGRTEAALRLWRSSLPSAGSPVTTYLQSRGISLAAPESVRFHPSLKHPDGGNWPGMVALVTRGTDSKPLAIHRTFLSCSGTEKAAVTPQKMMLGPCRNGAVRLAMAVEKVLLGEGIETCFAAMQATGLPAWAALSTSGLRALQLPDAIREVIVLADGDEPGEAAAFEAAKRWKREGRNVRVARPPAGKDFNDVLLDRITGAQEGTS